MIGLDKFYTKSHVSLHLINVWKEKVLLTDNNSLIIEPSAGNGSFYNILKQSFNVVAYDIKPENEEIIKQDFLSLDIPNNCHIIGNPPFGRQSSLAKKFIKKSCEHALSVSFILPKSFKKESYQRSFPLNYHLIHSEDLPRNSFTIDKKEYDVECVFQIWLRRDYDREVELEEEPLFDFVKKGEGVDFAIRRVGVNAGKISTNILDANIQSNYFIKIREDVDVFEERYLSNVTFSHNNTVGPRSISKRELIKEINKILREI